MAQGDFTLFQAFLDASTEDDINGQQIDFENDEFKIMLTTSTPIFTATDAVPAYGTGASTDISTFEVSGGIYVAGGLAISGPTVTRATATSTFNDDGSNVSWASDPSNPTEATWAVLYDNTTTLKHAIGFYDLGGNFNMRTGDLTITFSSNGLIQWAIQTSQAYAA